MADSILTAPAAAPAAAAPAPGAAAPAAAPAPGATAPAAGDWMAGYSPEARAAIEAKGYKSAADVAQGWFAANKLVGVDPAQVLKLPPKDADEVATKAAMDAIYGKLGRPETPDGYSLPKELEADPVAAGFREAAHGAGLSTTQAERLLEWYTGAAGKAGETSEAAAAEAQDKRFAALQKEVGAEKWPGFLEDARRAARVLLPETYTDPATNETLTREQLGGRLESALGRDLAVKIMAAAAQFTTREDKTELGQPAAAGMLSLEAARARKAALRNDKAWVGRWASGDAAARKEMAQLDAVIAAG